MVLLLVVITTGIESFGLPDIDQWRLQGNAFLLVASLEK
jgi:hypothetical protein